jgi:hypothetical protein
MIAQLIAAPAVVAFGVVKTAAAIVDRAQVPAPITRPPYVGPPLVAVDGWLHQDVVRAVVTGWTGTVLHSRTIGTGSLARVRWSGTFATTPLETVSERLQLVSRKAR